MTPKQIVKELDRYIVGQMKAKKAVAIALRNRWRRQQVEGSLKDEILPNNIIMIGSTGVGKTEIAKVLSETLNRPLVRLQCYEGLDVSSAVYEWNYSLQMVEIRLSEAVGDRDRDAIADNLFSEKFLIKRPLLQALEPCLDGPPILLIDELDRTDEPFEAYLLEVLSDFQITIPEIGTIAADEPPIVIITSNRTREIHDALKRRFRAKAKRNGLIQATGRRGNNRLGACAYAIGLHGSGSRYDKQHAWNASQISGRY